MSTYRFTRMAYSPRLWLMAIGWWNKINQCRKLKLNLTQTWVTRMAYSPSLWLMAIGWWNKNNQCRYLKLNLTQTWEVCMSLDLGMHWSQNQWYCDDKLRKDFFRHTLSLCSCERGPISQTVVFHGGFFCLGRSFPFPSLIGFFPSFCQALAEDRVTTPTQKKKKNTNIWIFRVELNIWPNTRTPYLHRWHESRNQPILLPLPSRKGEPWRRQHQLGAAFRCNKHQVVYR